MFAEYEKAQLMERYRRGKACRTRSGSVNVLSGAPFGYRYVRKTPDSGARCEIIEHEAVLVAETFRAGSSHPGRGPSERRASGRLTCPDVVAAGPAHPRPWS